MRRASWIAAAIAFMGCLLASVSAVAQVKVIQRVWVQAPDKAPDGSDWDTIIGGVLTFRLAGLYPDIKICLTSAHVPRACAPVCQDSKTCEREFGTLLEKSVFVEVVDVDPDGEQPIARYEQRNPETCQPCSYDTPGGPFLIRFDIADQAAYYGGFKGQSGNVPPPSAPPAANPRAVPAGPRLTAAQVKAALARIQGADSCGGNKLYPSGTVINRANTMLSGDEFDRLYQMATFVSAIDNPALKQRVMEQMRRRIANDDEYDTIFRGIILKDVDRSWQLTQAYKDLLEEMASAIISKGLDKFVNFPSITNSTLEDKVKDWMFDKTAETSAQEMVDAFWFKKLTAECALNEMAKRGVMQAVGP